MDKKQKMVYITEKEEFRHIYKVLNIENLPKFKSWDDEQLILKRLLDEFPEVDYIGCLSREDIEHRMEQYNWIHGGKQYLEKYLGSLD